MPSTNANPEFWAHSTENLRRWDLPAGWWSAAEYGEDAIIVVLNVRTGEWSARTERDQYARRALDAEDIASIRNEYNLLGAA